ncbi:MFS transporter [Micromonospora sp. M12]
MAESDPGPVAARVRAQVDAAVLPGARGRVGPVRRGGGRSARRRVHDGAGGAAGPGARWREPSCRDWPELLDDLTGRIADELDGTPYGLFGHSLGALVGYELAHRLRCAGDAPDLLVLAGRNPPWMPPGPALRHAAELSDQELFARLVALGGADARSAGPLTYRTFLPTLRADLRLAHSYRPGSPRPRLASPVVVLHGGDDPLTSPQALAGGPRSPPELPAARGPGGHFFPLERPAEVARCSGTPWRTWIGTGEWAGCALWKMCAAGGWCQGRPMTTNGPVSVLEAPAGRREWLALAVLALPTVLVAVDLSVLFLALPQLATDLGANAVTQLWIGDVYGFMVAGLLVTMGAVGDRIGRRRLLLVGAAAFAGFSLLAAFSTSSGMLVVSRAMLGWPAPRSCRRPWR